MSKSFKLKDQIIGKIEIKDNFGRLHETNPIGLSNMNDFTLRVAEKLENLEIPITFIMQGLPYADFNLHYQLCKIDEFGFSLILTMYPAGFSIRYNEMLKDLDEFCQNMVKQIPDSFNNYKAGIPINHSFQDDHSGLYWYLTCKYCNYPKLTDGTCNSNCEGN